MIHVNNIMEIIGERKIYTVSDINREIRTLLESRFQNIWIKGEISNYRMPPSGHCYFTLKDKDAQLKAVCFRLNNANLKFKLEDGLEVLARGRITAYEPRGDYQIVVDYVEPVGLGSLQLAFEQLKEKLRREGLFDEAHKRPIPLLPFKIGIVTSPTGAAIRDMLRVLKRRNKSLNILIYPAKVQGDGAANEIVVGIQHLNSYSDIDVIIVGRGGGSIEDLWCFNEEIVARAIASSRIPIISAVGHEIDFTISDFAADLRAPTPSAAAELVSAASEELRSRLESVSRRLYKTVNYVLENRRTKLMLLKQTRGFSGLPDKIRDLSQRLDDYLYRNGVRTKGLVVASRNRYSLIESRLNHINLPNLMRLRRELLAYRVEHLTRMLTNLLSKQHQSFELLLGKFNALSPLSVLERGYSICRKQDGSIVKQITDVRMHERIKVTLAKGEMECEIRNLGITDGGHPTPSVRTGKVRAPGAVKPDRPTDQLPLLFGPGD